MTGPQLSKFETDHAVRAGGAFRADKGKSIEAAERLRMKRAATMVHRLK